MLLERAEKIDNRVFFLGYKRFKQVLNVETVIVHKVGEVTGTVRKMDSD